MPERKPVASGATIPGLGGVDRFLARREVDALQGVLEEHEKVRAAAGGQLGRAKGLLAATTHRILFLSMGARSHVRSWGYARVERVHAEVDLDEAAITLHADHEVHVVRQVERQAAQRFADAVRDAAPKSQFRRVELVDDAGEASGDRGMFTLVDERLRRLKRQLDDGILTEPEYRANRRRILENAGMPTDLRLGMSTRVPIKDAEPAPPDRPWPKREKKAQPEKGPAPWPDPKLPK
jgi:hypothetical protein